MARYGILSHIHGNRLALERALDFLDHSAVDRVVYLGEPTHDLILFDGDLGVRVGFFCHTSTRKIYELTPGGRREVVAPDGCALAAGRRYLVNPGAVDAPGRRAELAVFDSAARTIQFASLTYQPAPRRAILGLCTQALLKTLALTRSADATPRS